MGWAIGWDNEWKRDIGYGVPAYCDEPGCEAEIDRGMSYHCESCGLFFCSKHLGLATEDDPCDHDTCPEVIKEDHPDWIRHKLTDESWQQWRDENPREVEKLKLAQGDRDE